MIGLTRTNGEHCRLDPDLIQRVEGHPVTVVYLTDGAKYPVVNSVDDVVRAVREDRAAVQANGYRLTCVPGEAVVGAPAVPPRSSAARRPVMPVPRRED